MDTKKISNDLPESKTFYVHALLLGREPLTGFISLFDVAILFYHCEIPLEEAKTYMNNYEFKIKVR